MDAGAYTIKISQILLGNKLEVIGSSLTIPEDKDVEIFGSAMLENQTKDKTSFLHFGFDNFYKCGIEILGSKGEIYTNRLFTAPADYEPLIYLKNHESSVELKVDKDDHFVKMLKYFYKLSIDKKCLEKEYLGNLDQARIMDSIKKKSGLFDD